jgi:hypothetical protein
MNSKLMFASRQNRKRARSTARRLLTVLKKYQRDPDSNAGMQAEAAALAVRASYYLREAETAGRIILTDHGERRQIFLRRVTH